LKILKKNDMTFLPTQYFSTYTLEMCTLLNALNFYEHKKRFRKNYIYLITDIFCIFF